MRRMDDRVALALPGLCFGLGWGFLSQLLLVVLTRQSFPWRILEREGIDLDRSTLTDWIGKSAALLEPLAEAIGRHVQGGQAIFADDTLLKMQAPGHGRAKTARIWTYVRDERPWLGQSPPAAWYRFTVDRKGEHPAQDLTGYQGWMHADGYAGFNELYRSGAIEDVACMAHIRRKFDDLFQSQGSVIAEEAIRRIAGLYGVEKQARGQAPEVRVRLSLEPPPRQMMADVFLVPAVVRLEYRR